MKMHERAVWGAAVLALTGWLAVEKSTSHSSSGIGASEAEQKRETRFQTSSANSKMEADRTPRKSKDTGGRGTAALRISDPLQRMTEFLEVLSSCDRSGIESVAAALGEMKAKGISVPAEEELLNFRMGQLRGQEIFSRQTGVPTDPGQFPTLTKQFEGWAGSDPRAAAQWLSGIPNGRYRDKMAIAYLRTCKLDDPAGALELVSSLHPTQQAAAGRALAEQLTQTNSAEESSALLATLEHSAAPANTAFLQTLFDSLASTTGTGDATLAAGMVEEHLNQGIVSPVSLTNVASGLGKKDPVAALDWAASIQFRKKDLPPGTMLTAAINGMTLDGLNRAEEWTAAHPDAPGIDRMWQALQKQRETLKEDLSENPDEYHRGD